MAYTDNKSLNSKVDNGMNLAGREHIPNPLGTTGVVSHLRYSPAGGAPVHQDAFTLGHRWTEVDGKIQPSSGKTNI